MHITASVFINDDESGLHHDYEVWLEKLAPHAPTTAYRHNRTGEDNADAHLKRQIMGREVVVAITKGKLDFGPWEQIFYGEFDGRRQKASAGEDHRRVGLIGRCLVICASAVPPGYGSRTTRKPSWQSRESGVPPSRRAHRTVKAELSNAPPRETRDVPVGGPCGSSTGDFL